ncbi:MAG TPA: radical SAM protein [Pyrinomonadaceae bacterium]|jgi:MoaA/NifB/PqqE/SkfB family radical SAM enzyme|nr:radical SAM protein [Pyrinomonadaceae bacterium]
MSESKGTMPWPPRPVFRSGGYAATPRPAEGVVTWNINTTCNYRCTYCTQRFVDDRKRWLRDGPAFLKAFAALEGRWEIKISGGEPFLHPHLNELAAGLRETGHAVSVVTNFSADEEKLSAFIDAAGPALRVFSASLHLEYAGTQAALEAFIRKAERVRARLPPGASFNVTCVATRANLPRLEDLAALFAHRGLRFKVQPEKQDREVISYTEAEREIILRLGGHNGLGEVAPSFGGRPCWAGARSFTLDDRGNAWRCYPARRFRTQFLGNFLDGSFRLARGPSPCLYAYCNCTVPIERHMMPRDARGDDEAHEVQNLS